MTNDKKRIAIITGASSGFGRIFALKLEKMIDLEEIWLVARREEKLKDTAMKLERVKGVVIKADLSKPEGLDIISEKAAKENVSLRVLINNAGFGRSEEFLKGEEDYYNRMIEVNIKAPVILSRRLIKYMNEGSKILNISSSAAFAPLPYFAVYASTKSFILNFSYALSEELKEKDISVTCVCPGPASTEFFKENNKKINGIKIEDPVKIVNKALRDMSKRKMVSVYGIEMNAARLLSKFVPKKYLARFAGMIKFPK